MITNDFVRCFRNSSLILTEGAVGLRLAREFHLSPDDNINYAGLIYQPEGRKALETIYRQYLQIAQDYELPILLMTGTRRCNSERVRLSPYKNKNILRDYANFLRELADGFLCRAFIGGMMGCKGDAYSGEGGLSAEESLRFHSWQAEAFRDADVDYLIAGIMPTLPETIGMAQAMEKTELPYILSFMINKSGTLLDGNTICDSIRTIDGATDSHPLCYMTNCVHPSILKEALSQPFNDNALVRNRFRGIQANASCLPPEELDRADGVIAASAKELVDEFIYLHLQFPLKIYGGCCGTDDTHIRETASRMRIVQA